MSQLNGSSAELRLGFEPSFGVPATTMFKVPYAPTNTIQTAQPLNSSTVMNGSRSATKGFLGFKDGTGSLVVPVDLDAIGVWLKGFFGAPTTIGAGPYTHKFKINDTVLPSVSLEMAHLDRANTFYRHIGFKCNTFGLSLGGDDELLMNIGLIGQDSTLETTQIIAPDITLSSGDKFQKFENVVSSLSSANSVSTYSIDYTNDLDGTSYTVNQGAGRQDIPLGQVGVTGSIEALALDNVLATSSANFTTETLISTITKGTSSLLIEINELNLDKKVGQAVESAQGIKETYEYTAFSKDHADSSSIVITLVNDIASYA